MARVKVTSSQLHRNKAEAFDYLKEDRGAVLVIAKEEKPPGTGSRTSCDDGLEGLSKLIMPDLHSTVKKQPIVDSVDRQICHTISVPC